MSIAYSLTRDCVHGKQAPRIFGAIGLCLSLIVGRAATAQVSTVELAAHTPLELTDGTAKRTAHYDPAKMLRLTIGLKHPHEVAEQQFIAALNDRKSLQFHKFLSPSDWVARFAPDANDEAAVVRWAQSAGLTVTRRFPNRLIVDLEGSAGAIEKALNVRINAYQVGSRATFSNDNDPSIPGYLAETIHSIGGLNNIQTVRPASRQIASPVFPDYGSGPAESVKSFVHAKPKSPARVDDTGPSNASSSVYSPSDLFGSSGYNLAPLMALNQCCDNSTFKPELSIAIATAGDFAASDLDAFANSYGLGYSVETVAVDGDPSTCGAQCNEETTLDVEWATAWSQTPALTGDAATYRSILVFEGFNDGIGTFTDVYEDILTSAQTRIMTTSWGCAETLCTPNATMDTDHGIFLAMTAQGWTLIAAAGDNGPTTGCVSQDALNYPASDPNVLAAGGTVLSLSSNGNSYESEQGWSGYSCAINEGGSGGGFSHYFVKPGYQNTYGYPSRAVPDISLNAGYDQALYLNGTWYGAGGTSIVAPELAGFFVQANAYLDAIASATGTASFAPIAFANEQIYLFGVNSVSVPFPHNPFYDITSGCNANDITSQYNLTYYCASTGFDQVTGWGSFNALQLSWMFNFYYVGDLHEYDLPGYTGTPRTSITGPAIHSWYKSDQLVTWTLDDVNVGKPIAGVAGYTADWDLLIPDSASEPTPGFNDGFYTGPLTPLATAGRLALASAGQGCHIAQIRAWDNAGVSAMQTYGPLCYDTVPPVTVASEAGIETGGVFSTPVTVTLKATDAASGVKSTSYSLDGGTILVYAAPFAIAVPGTHTLRFQSIDVAGNLESLHTISINIAASSSSLKLSEGSLAFSSQAIASSSAAQTVTLTNTGSGTLSFTSISVTGAQADDYSLSKTCGTTLAPGSSCGVSVIFKPVSAGVKSAAITFFDTATGSPQSVDLRGTGVAAGAELSLSSSSLIYPETAPGASSAAQSVSIKNLGGVTVPLSSIAITGGQADDFTLTTTCRSSLAAGSSCTIAVTFKPVSVGVKSAALTLTDNASDSPQRVRLSGTGGSSTATLGLTPSNIVFPSTAPGVASTPQIVTLKNTGSATASISSIAITGGQADDFSLTTTCGSSLAAGSSCTIAVTFKPVSAGVKAAAVTLTDSATESPQSVALRATGT